MSAKKRVINVGQAVRASDINAVAGGAASADDRALEVSFTPGAAQKAVMPLSGESATVNPRLLIVGQDTDVTVPNGKVRVRPSHFKAGVSGDAYSIALAASLKANTDSLGLAFNSSGSTRTDLLYATISYQATKTESVRVKPLTGGDPVSQSFTTETTPTVTLGVVANVASGNPLASLPADDNVNGVYYFGLAAVSIPNGWSGAGITQSQITQLWSAGYVAPQRIRGARPMSLYYGSAAEKPSSTLTSGVQGAERWSAGRTPFFVHFRMLASSGTAVATGVVLDDSIDWRYRLAWGFAQHLGSGLILPIESQPAIVPPSGQVLAAPGPFYDSGQLGIAWTGPGCTGTDRVWGYNHTGAANRTLSISVDTAGRLIAFSQLGPQDPTNGDVFVIALNVSDPLV